jgi:hypothetical protein
VAARILLGIVGPCGACLALLLPPTAPQRETAHPTRRLLYPPDAGQLKPPLAPFVEKLLSPNEKKVSPPPPHPADVRIFLRVVSKKYVLDGAKLRQNAWLGSRPFVFLTLPETLYGKTLAETFSDIGYSADEVLSAEVGEEKVALVFAYPEGITLHPHRGGELPDSWERKVYVPTWDNLFALAERLVRAGRVEIDPMGQRFTPDRLRLRGERERHFVLGFPEAGKRRIKANGYAVLREIGGADWEYRALLERSLSAAEHFSGDGYIRPTFGRRPLPPRGFPEFLGPNLPIEQTAALAVIYLGKLQITE